MLGTKLRIPQTCYRVSLRNRKALSFLDRQDDPDKTGVKRDAGAKRTASLNALGDNMKVRASFLAVAGSAIVVLVSTLAQSRIHPGLQADSLARYEAITSYCEKADPGSAAEYVSKLASFTAGRSDKELALDRASAHYRNAMAQANATLSMASPSTGVKGCTEFLAEK
jgi:hypothetical protein